MNKYLLCIPYGGYNDQISVIYHCYMYCQQVGRILLLYTNVIDKLEEEDDNILNSIYTFDLNKYIHFNLENFITDTDTIENIIENIDDINISQYIPFYEFKIPKKLERYITFKNNVNRTQFNDISFLFMNLPHRVISYCNCGGNYDLDINYLNKFYFKEPIKSIYLERIELLPKYYVSFHIRNTDYKCDYKKIFEENKNLLEHPIYLATDSVEVLEYVKSIAKNKVYQFSNLHYENKPIHMSYNIIDKEKRFIELILDLLCVANSNIFVPSVGGFSALCNKYFNNKHLIQFY